MKDSMIITCPKCGTEYLPCEIFLPNAFLGKAKNIQKNDLNKIEDFSGNNMCLTEEYICDNCGTTFSINAKVQFNTSIDQKRNFSDGYKTNIFKKLSMDEK